ncbi:MAG: hypothetical protein SFY80_06030 [Verrucomicrobiota bacterium]|nr:hypothetical protein [Verrucomicrobiota bacterium]
MPATLSLRLVKDMGLIRRFLLWRNGRQHRHGYKLDSRRYDGSKFGPGFFSYMGRIRFWGKRNARYRKPQRLFAPLQWLFYLAGIAVLVWLVLESINALRLF